MELFEAVGEATRSMIPADLGAPMVRSHRYGVKVWFGDETPTKLHYEAQVVGARHVAGAEVLAIEVGFHAEERSEADNEAAVARLLVAEKRWRKVLGPEPVAGPFLGRDSWRRISETWPDPDLGEDDLALELAARLTDYVTEFEPLLRD
jgi:hypothetical protein